MIYAWLLSLWYAAFGLHDPAPLRPGAEAEKSQDAQGEVPPARLLADDGRPISNGF